ncbi:hypothetical protein H7F33_14225 [Pedobacter sp. PAMC26386]|nr:hypothetical protein H7F33_14225 [Pedobacter sp. PAMC26386]
MKKLLVIPAFLLFMSAIPASTVQQSGHKPKDLLKIDQLNDKLQKLDSLIKETR